MLIPDNRTPQNIRETYCNDLPAPSMRPPGWMRAQDQSEPFDSPPVMPSIREYDNLEPSGVMAKLDRKLARQDDTLGKLALALKALDAALELLGTEGISLDTFRTDNRPCAILERKGNTYDVRRIGS
jgi:hypothetical protein